MKGPWNVWNEDLAVRFRRRVRPALSILRHPHPRLEDFLVQERVDLVFDVGANEGQFGRSLRYWGYHGRIVSFEPVSSTFARLEATIREAADPLWNAVCSAVGSHDGESEIHVAELDVYSSIRASEEVLSKFDGRAQPTRTERIRVSQLDSIADGYLEPSTRPFLKIDTQGYEYEVLQGARRTLERCIGAQLEIPSVPLYKDQRCLGEMVTLLENWGFVLVLATPVNFDPRTKRLLELDCVFCNRAQVSL